MTLYVSFDGRERSLSMKAHLIMFEVLFKPVHVVGWRYGYRIVFEVMFYN